MKKFLKPVGEFLLPRDDLTAFPFRLGKPENAQIGIANTNDPLPTSIDGLCMSMLNQSAKKARLTFKLESDEIWINTGKRILYFAK